MSIVYGLIIIAPWYLFAYAFHQSHLDRFLFSSKSIAFCDPTVENNGFAFIVPNVIHKCVIGQEKLIHW